jgi:hypothetical protein
MQSMYQHNLYGDAARGCHHRGDGPDASQRTISHNRRRHEDLDEEGSRRNPFGCLEVGAEKIVHDVTQGIKPAKPWNLGSVSLSEGGKNDGSEEEGSEEAGSQEGRQEEEVTTSSFVVT